MQRAYINKLYQIIQNDKNVISVLSDSGTDYDEMLKRDFPDQCINLGIAEENLVAVAAGLAAGGKIPFVYTSGAFLAYRAYEFVRDDVCLQKNPVKLVGMGSGLAWSTLGPSHHTTEDISVLRAIPGLMLLCPASPLELASMVEFAYRYDGPVYIRMGMSREKEVYQEDYKFIPGKIQKILDGEKLAFLSTGSILEEVLEACERLKRDGIEAAVFHVPSLKPFDEEGVGALSDRYHKVITVEEHNVYGGLGSIISEVVAEYGYPLRVRRMGLQDCFAKGYGRLKDVRRQNGLSAEDIYYFARAEYDDE